MKRRPPMEKLSKVEEMVKFRSEHGEASGNGEEERDDSEYDKNKLENGGPHVVDDDIRKAYHKQALKVHPDKCGNNYVSDEEFLVLQRAYGILGNKEKRASYDELRQVRKERVEKETRSTEKRKTMMRNLAEKEKAHLHELKTKSQRKAVNAKLKAEITTIVKEMPGRSFTFKDGTTVRGPPVGKDEAQPYQPPPFNSPTTQSSQHAPLQFAEPYQPPPLPLNWGKALSYKPPPSNSF